MNQFYYSLRNMGIITDFYLDGDWDEKNMITPACFYRLKSLLQERRYDIEPFDAFYPFRNRLTRRWWDDSFVRAQWSSR